MDQIRQLLLGQPVLGAQFFYPGFHTCPPLNVKFTSCEVDFMLSGAERIVKRKCEVYFMFFPRV